MRDEALGFGKVADAYERGRPGYPQEIVDWIATRAGLGPGTTVVDLAAGTGKLTRLLMGTGAQVLAVEPVAGMRDELVRRLPELDVLDGTAEAMPLPDVTADAVTVAQAFHWFANDDAVAEIARVLRPGGLLAVVFNRWDHDHAEQVTISEIMEPYRAYEPAHSTGEWRGVLAASPLFEPAGGLSAPNEQVLDADGVADRVGSVSFIAKLPDEVRAQVLADARGLAAAGPVTLRYVAEVSGYAKA
jgi:SAM-dependent methyltransferase